MKALRLPLMIVIGLLLAPLATVAAQETYAVAFEKGDAEQLELRLAPSAAELRLGALESPFLLVAGTVGIGPRETLNRSFDTVNQMAAVSLESERRFSIFQNSGRLLWNLQVTRDMPVNLIIEAGIGSLQLNLTELNLSGLFIRTGVGEAAILLPASGSFAGVIEAGVGEITLHVPAGMGARIEVTTGIGSVSVNGNFNRQGMAYVTPNYESAENRIDLTIKGGIGDIHIATAR